MRPRYADLFRRMGDPDPIERDAAFDAVLFDRGEALPDLVSAYKVFAKDTLRRFYAVQLMGFSGDKRAIPPLMKALDDPEAAVRAEACRSLEDLRAKDALPALRARLDDMDAEVRIAAREALAHLGS
ncbi:MAG: HEAT repeat domain-containing protein [Myxococcota bacterium]|nr:HEAT repeat domain-containing protein [Myxococcota bacterium]